MSRSKHTRPDRIRAADRVRAPFDDRAADDLSTFRQLARELKENGVMLDEVESLEDAEPIYPRFIVKRARAGFIHPAGKSDILRLLEFFGEQCYYGLKTVKLMQGADSCKSASILMGRIEVPGSIILYDQPEPPWLISGEIAAPAVHQLEQAGAVVENKNGIQTVVHWTADALKNFMLFDVFMHEVGHHLIQQYKGKKNQRVARTKDHEHFAQLFALRCRRDFLEDSGALNV